MAKYLLFDTETTGIDESDRIIQIGGMIVHGKDENEVFDGLCATDVPIKLEAMEIHNITPDMIENQPPYEALEFAQKTIGIQQS